MFSATAEKRNGYMLGNRPLLVGFLSKHNQLTSYSLCLLFNIYLQTLTLSDCHSFCWDPLVFHTEKYPLTPTHLRGTRVELCVSLLKFWFKKKKNLILSSPSRSTSRTGGSSSRCSGTTGRQPQMLEKVVKISWFRFIVSTTAGNSRD